VSNKNRNRQQFNPANNTNQNQQAPVGDDAATGDDNQQNDDAGEDQEDGAGNDQQQQDNATQNQNSPVQQEQPVEQKEEPAKQEVKVEVKEQRKQKQEGFTPVYKVQLDLNNYAEAMDPKKPIVPEDGGKWQHSLFQLIKSVLNAKDQEEFNREWNTILIFMNEHREGAFSENFVFRFPEHWTGSPNEFATFRRLLFTMLQTSNPQTRKQAIKEINLALTCEGLTEAQRVKVLNFYE
jgi:hypothetical protein